MISRVGIEGQKAASGALRVLLEKQPYPDRATLETLDRAYIAQNLSPGGCADLLAICWMLHFLKEAEL